MADLKRHYPEYIKPSLDTSRFTCPHCRGTADQTQVDVYLAPVSGEFTATNDATLTLDDAPTHGFLLTQCTGCKEYIIWYKHERRWPPQHIAPPPSERLPSEVMWEYQDAVNSLPSAPRASVLLLNLALKMICHELNPEALTMEVAIKSAMKSRNSNSQAILEKIRALHLDNALTDLSATIRPREAGSNYVDTAIQLCYLLNEIAGALLP